MGILIHLLCAIAVSFFGAICFVAGYFIATRSIRPLNHSDEDDDDKEEKKMRVTHWLLHLAQAVIRRKSSDKKIADPMAVLDQKIKIKKPALLEIETLAEILEDFKMVLVVRNDLKMGKGKIAAQCSHATLGLYKKLHNRAPKALNRWEMCGQVKVVLRTESEEDMLILLERAKSLKLPSHITIDAGRTQIAPNSRTVMAIIGPTDVVDDVTGGLKLL